MSQNINLDNVETTIFNGNDVSEIKLNNSDIWIKPASDLIVGVYASTTPTSNAGGGMLYYGVDTALPRQLGNLEGVKFDRTDLTVLNMDGKMYIGLYISKATYNFIGAFLNGVLDSRGVATHNINNAYAPTGNTQYRTVGDVSIANQNFRPLAEVTPEGFLPLVSDYLRLPTFAWSYTDSYGNVRVSNYYVGWGITSDSIWAYAVSWESLSVLHAPGEFTNYQNYTTGNPNNRIFFDTNAGKFTTPVTVNYYPEMMDNIYVSS